MMAKAVIEDKRPAHHSVITRRAENNEPSFGVYRGGSSVNCDVKGWFYSQVEAEFFAWAMDEHFEEWERNRQT